MATDKNTNTSSNKSGEQPRKTDEEPTRVLPQPPQTPLFRATQGGFLTRVTDVTGEVSGVSGTDVGS